MANRFYKLTEVKGRLDFPLVMDIQPFSYVLVKMQDAEGMVRGYAAWGLGRIGGSQVRTRAKGIDGLFDFIKKQQVFRI